MIALHSENDFPRVRTIFDWNVLENDAMSLGELVHGHIVWAKKINNVFKHGASLRTMTDLTCKALDPGYPGSSPSRSGAKEHEIPKVGRHPKPWSERDRLEPRQVRPNVSAPDRRRAKTNDNSWIRMWIRVIMSCFAETQGFVNSIVSYFIVKLCCANGAFNQLPKKYQGCRLKTREYIFLRVIVRRMKSGHKPNHGNRQSQTFT